MSQYQTQPTEQMEIECAKKIVARYQQRGGVPPKHITRSYQTEEEQQECQDAEKLTSWKNALNHLGGITDRCYPAVAAYLDAHMPGWSVVRNFEEEAMQFAEAIVARYQQRGRMLPKVIVKDNKSEEERQENSDAQKLAVWKKARTHPHETSGKCYPAVAAYLDAFIPDWCDSNRISAACH